MADDSNQVRGAKLTERLSRFLTAERWRLEEFAEMIEEHLDLMGRDSEPELCALGTSAARFARSPESWSAGERDELDRRFEQYVRTASPTLFGATYDEHLRLIDDILQQMVPPADRVPGCSRLEKRVRVPESAVFVRRLIAYEQQKRSGRLTDPFSA